MKIFKFSYTGFAPQFQKEYNDAEHKHQELFWGTYVFIKDKVSPDKFITSVPLWEADLNLGSFFINGLPMTLEDFSVNSMNIFLMQRNKIRVSEMIYVPKTTILRLENVKMITDGLMIS